MGYSKTKNKKLLTLYSGKPYIDVRKSFSSFLPKTVSTKDKIKIINFGLKNYKNNLFLHDKIEFDIAITAYDFEFKKKLNNNLPNSINAKTKKKLAQLYKNIFIRNINEKSYASLKYIENKIENLIILQKKFLYMNLKKK